MYVSLFVNAFATLSVVVFRHIAVNHGIAKLPLESVVQLTSFSNEDGVSVGSVILAPGYAPKSLSGFIAILNLLSHKYWMKIIARDTITTKQATGLLPFYIHSNPDY